MTRHDTDIDLDPTIAAELQALEAALADVPGADPELVALVRKVRDEAPSMPLALRERLDADVAVGFPRKRRRWVAPAWMAGRLPLVVGAGAAVLVAAVVSVNVLNQADPVSRQALVTSASEPTQSTDAAGSPVEPSAKSAAPSVESSSAAGAATAAPAAPTASSVAPTTSLPTPGRKVERAVDLTLTVGAGELQKAADNVVRATQSVGGYVSVSQVDATPRGGEATFTLRVPTANLDMAVSRLSKLGHVSALSQSAQDITAAFDSATTRLADARSERSALLRALGRATDAGQIAVLRTRIAGNRADITRLHNDLTAVRHRADLATINVTVQSHRSAVAPGGGGGWTPGDAAHDALRVLEVAAGVALVSAAALVPLALLALLGVLGARVTRRRRREHALDVA